MHLKPNAIFGSKVRAPGQARLQQCPIACSAPCSGSSSTRCRVRTHRLAAARSLGDTGFPGDLAAACAAASGKISQAVPEQPNVQLQQQQHENQLQQHKEQLQQQDLVEQAKALLQQQQVLLQDWESWKEHFEVQDENGSQLDILCSQLEAAVAAEDYSAAASLKAEIQGLVDADHMANLSKQMQLALDTEDYVTVARLRNQGCTWLEGWWASSDSDGNTGHLLRVTQEYGRWTGKSYTAHDLAVIKGLVDQTVVQKVLARDSCVADVQTVAAAAAATARVVRNLLGRQQQRRQGLTESVLKEQEGLVMLGSPVFEVFVDADAAADDVIISSAAEWPNKLSASIPNQQQQQYISKAVLLSSPYRSIPTFPEPIRYSELPRLPLLDDMQPPGGAAADSSTGTSGSTPSNCTYDPSYRLNPDQLEASAEIEADLAAAAAAAAADEQGGAICADGMLRPLQRHEQQQQQHPLLHLMVKIWPPPSDANDDNSSSSSASVANQPPVTMQGLANQPGQPTVMVVARVLFVPKAETVAAAAAAGAKTSSSSSSSRTAGVNSVWEVFELRADAAGLQDAVQQHDGASVDDGSFYRHPATLTAQGRDQFSLQTDALPDAEAVEAATAALCLQNDSSSSSSSSSRDNARDGGDVSSQPPLQQQQQEEQLVSWQMFEEPEHCDPTIFVIEIPLKGVEDAGFMWSDTEPIWQSAAQQVLTQYACSSSSSSQDPAAAAQGSAAAGFSTLPAWFSTLLPAWQRRLADSLMAHAVEATDDYLGSVLGLRSCMQVQDSSSRGPFSLQQPLLIAQLPSIDSGSEDEAATVVAAGAPTAAAAVADHATSAEAEAAAAAAVADPATSAEAVAAAVLSGSTAGSRGYLRSYRRLTNSLGGNSSSSSSSSDVLQGYFLGPVHLDRSDPQLLQLQMGECPESGRQMLLATSVTGDSTWSAGDVLIRADVNPRSDVLPVEVFPSKLGVVARYPADIAKSDLGKAPLGKWHQGELLRFKQSSVPNELTEGAQLGLMWKPEGSRKNFMVLLHRIELQDL